MSMQLSAIDRRNLATNMNKTDQRHQLLAVRRALLPEFIKEASDIICKSLFSMDEYRTCEDIYLYADMRSEVMTSAAIEHSFKCNKNVYLPITDGDNMDFYSYGPGDVLTKGDFGVMVPGNGTLKLPDRGLMVVPGVGFDKSGYRIGYGKGYYDRYLSKYTNLCKMGFAYECQVIDAIEIDEHDQRLDYLITEKCIYNFRR